MRCGAEVPHLYDVGGGAICQDSDDEEANSLNVGLGATIFFEHKYQCCLEVAETPWCAAEVLLLANIGGDLFTLEWRERAKHTSSSEHIPAK